MRVSRKIDDVFSSGTEVTYIYDLGTSSEMLLKTVSAREGQPLIGKLIYLMARNKLPEVECSECNTTAGWYCADCLVERGQWINLCEAHRTDHDHDEYGGPSPLVNLSRLGMCGYDGPAEPPY